MACELCHRDIKLTFHHLVPKKVQDKQYILKKLSLSKDVDLNTYGIYLCKDCHATVHRVLDHFELGLDYNTLDKLRQHPEIIKFVSWASKQDKKVKR